MSAVIIPPPMGGAANTLAPMSPMFVVLPMAGIVVALLLLFSRLRWYWSKAGVKTTDRRCAKIVDRPFSGLNLVSIFRRMGKHEEQAHHTSTYVTCQVTSRRNLCFRAAGCETRGKPSPGYDL